VPEVQHGRARGGPGGGPGGGPVTLSLDSGEPCTLSRVAHCAPFCTEAALSSDAPNTPLALAVPLPVRSSRRQEHGPETPWPETSATVAEPLLASLVPATLPELRPNSLPATSPQAAVKELLADEGSSASAAPLAALPHPAANSGPLLVATPVSPRASTAWSPLPVPAPVAVTSDVVANGFCLIGCGEASLTPPAPPRDVNAHLGLQPLQGLASSAFATLVTAPPLKSIARGPASAAPASSRVPASVSTPASMRGHSASAKRKAHACGQSSPWAVVTVKLRGSSMADWRRQSVDHSTVGEVVLP